MSEISLSADEHLMLQAAKGAFDRAYAPYSRFHVGAVVVDEHGQLHVGCNVENAAYPQGVCAEAGAISAMALAGGRRIRKVMVYAQADSVVTPCGGCRQKLREFADDHTPVLMVDPTGLRLRLQFSDLLPHSFGAAHLTRVDGDVASISNDRPSQRI